MPESDSERLSSTEGSSTSTLLLLVFMPAVAAWSVLGVQLYLGAGVRPLTMAMIGSLALFVYSLNGLSDRVEDAANDAARAATLRRSALWLLTAAAAGMLISGVALAYERQLHGLYAIVAFVGVVYSFRLIPWPTAGRLGWVRLKDVLLVKNLAIGGTWAGAAFLGPLFDLAVLPVSVARLTLVGVGYGILAVVNSMFCDVRDVHGDSAAGVRTLPVRFGARRCFAGIVAAMVPWTAFLFVAHFAFGWIDLRHVALLSAAALGYPLVVWVVIERVRPRQTFANCVIESSTFLFALALMGLSL